MPRKRPSETFDELRGRTSNVVELTFEPETRRLGMRVASLLRKLTSTQRSRQPKALVYDPVSL